MDVNKIAYIAVEAGRIILENGGETYRVEDTINRICSAFNVSHADSFVTPTGIMMSVIDRNGQTISMIKRIRKRTVDLEKICKVNELSRNIANHNYSEDEVLAILKDINKLDRYSLLTTIIFSSLGAGFFTLLFGGNLKDFVGALVLGAILKSVTSYLNDLNINEFFINIFGGAIASFMALLLVRANISTNIDKVVIGSIMLLVPGLAITNAIRDTISGDIVAGVSRATEAFLVAIGIAIGSGLVLKIWISIFGGLV